PGRIVNTDEPNVLAQLTTKLGNGSDHLKGNDGIGGNDGWRPARGTLTQCLQGLDQSCIIINRALEALARHRCLATGNKRIESPCAFDAGTDDTQGLGYQQHVAIPGCQHMLDTLLYRLVVIERDEVDIQAAVKTVNQHDGTTLR